MKWHWFKDPLTPYKRVSYELLLNQHAFEIAFCVYDKKEECVEKKLISFLGLSNEVPQTRWLKQQNFIFLQSWRLEVQDEDISRSGFLLKHHALLYGWLPSPGIFSGSSPCIHLCSKISISFRGQ